MELHGSLSETPKTQTRIANTSKFAIQVVLRIANASFNFGQRRSKLRSNSVYLRSLDQS